MKPLETRFETHDGGVTVVTLSGDLFGSEEGYAFQDALRKQIADGARRIVLDGSGLVRIDSSGIGILVTVMWSASNAGSRLIVAGLPARVEKVLSMAMLLDHIDHAPTLDEGLARVSGAED